MHEPITVNVDRGRGDGAHSSMPITFTGRLLRTVEGDRTTMRLYEWADRGRLAYLVHVEEDRPGRPPRHTLYPFVNTHSDGSAPTKGYTFQGGFSGLPGDCRWEVRAAASRREILETAALPFAPIHPSVWKGGSKKFA
jgi:hypothetical protein